MIEPLDQLGQRALAAAAQAHHHGDLSGLQREVQTLVEIGMMLGVAEAKVAQFQGGRSLMGAAGNQLMRLRRHIDEIPQAAHG